MAHLPYFVENNQVSTRYINNIQIVFLRLHYPIIYSKQNKIRILHVTLNYGRISQ